MKPSEFLDRVNLSPQCINYKFPHIGYTWDSDTDISPDDWNTYDLDSKNL